MTPLAEEGTLKIPIQGTQRLKTSQKPALPQIIMHAAHSQWKFREEISKLTETTTWNSNQL